MIDPFDLLVEEEGDPEKIRESQRRRFEPDDAIDDFVKDCEKSQKAKAAFSENKLKIHDLESIIKDLIETKQDTASEEAQKAHLIHERQQLKDDVIDKVAFRDLRLKSVGNYIHDSVPVSRHSVDNAFIREWPPGPAAVPNRGTCLSHDQILAKLDGYEFQEAGNIAGPRGYFLKGFGVFLNLALVNFGLEFLYKKGYNPMQPPHMMQREYMKKVTQLEEFHDELYRADTDMHRAPTTLLIASVKQPLLALYHDKSFTDDRLPVRNAGFSTTYRRQSTSVDQETAGIFQSNQFEKIEQFLVTAPECSWAALETLINDVEEFYQALNIPYRIMTVISGELRHHASKKYQLEAWFPSQRCHRPLASSTNSTDYISRELSIRYEPSRATGRGQYVHTLSSTLCATERTLCCIIENYQTDKGVHIPEVLRKYIPGQPDFLPFVQTSSESIC